MTIRRLDHLVLTVASLEATSRFYADLLGMEVVRFGEGRTALRFGEQKINLHHVTDDIRPRAVRPTPGSADLCFVVGEPLAAIAARLEVAGVAIAHGPVEQTGALGRMRSIYVRDPDGNLVELARYEDGDDAG